MVENFLINNIMLVVVINMGIVSFLVVVNIYVNIIMFNLFIYIVYYVNVLVYVVLFWSR